MPSFKVTKKMETRRMHNSEMKKLLSTLHAGVSKDDIKALPRRLRSFVLASSSYSQLCSLHKDLDANLLKDIWSWMKYEFRSGIGKRVYPVMMAGKLTEAEERKIRHIEPVLQMWEKDFKPEFSAPAGRQSIDAGHTWTYQLDQCPACMLARIGSETDVLCALYAGMIARFPMHKLSSGKLILAELGVSKLDNPKSKRLRFVRYWIKASTKGNMALFEAVELGIIIKKKYREYKDGHMPETPTVYGRASLEGTTARNSLDPFHDGHGASEDTERPRTGHHSSRHTTTREPSIRSSRHSSRPTITDPKVSPQPRSSKLDPHTPLGNLGFQQSGLNVRDSSQRNFTRKRSDFNATVVPHDSITTILTGERIYVPKPNNPPSGPTIVNLPAFPGRAGSAQPQPLRPAQTSSYAASAAPAPLAPKKARPVSSLYSRRSTGSSFSTILSYDGGPTPPVPQRGAQRTPMYNIPEPARRSVYGGFGEVEQDPFEEADEEDVEEEYEEGDSGKDSRASTKWSELY